MKNNDTSSLCNDCEMSVVIFMHGLELWTCSLHPGLIMGSGVQDPALRCDKYRPWHGQWGAFNTSRGMEIRPIK